MDFTLVYEGPLATNGRSELKHAIRLQLHPQLKELWDHPPLSQFYWKERPGSDHLRKVGGYEFCSVVHPEWRFNAKLRVLMLRPEPPGHVLTTGADIDNRLKTLFDALACPRYAENIPKGWKPTEDERPLHCLLDDDQLISELTVETDRLLAAPAQTHVKLIIRVHVHTTGAFGGLAIAG